MYPQVAAISIGIAPVAFTIGSVEIRWESLMFLVALFLILLWLCHFGKRVSKGKLLLFDMSSKKYWSLGSAVANCWNVGKEIKKGKGV